MTGLLTLIDVVSGVLPAVIGSFAAATVEVNNIELNNKKIVEKAKETYNEEVSNDLAGQIKRLSAGSSIARACYTANADKTNDLVNYAMHEMTNIPSENDEEKMVLDDEDKAFINGVAEMAMYGKIYEDVPSDDIEKYDAKAIKIGKVGNYLLMIDEIKGRLVSDDFVSKWQAKKGLLSMYNPNTKLIAENESEDNTEESVPEEATSTFGKGRIDENGLYHPIFFDNSLTKYSQPEFKDDSISDEELDRVEAVIGSLLPSEQYHYYRKDAYGNMLVIIVKDNAYHAEEVFMIDDGAIMGGNSIYVLGSYIKPDGTPDTMFVNCNLYPEIARYIFASGFNKMTPEMVSTVVRSQFNNALIYHNVDLSETGFIDTINEAHKKLFEQNLTACIKVMDGDYRLRFESYIAPNKFTLVSDNNCVSTLQDGNITASQICDGLKLEICGNILTKTVNGVSTKINIIRESDKNE